MRKGDIRRDNANEGRRIRGRWVPRLDRAGEQRKADSEFLRHMSDLNIEQIREQQDEQDALLGRPLEGAFNTATNAAVVGYMKDLTRSEPSLHNFYTLTNGCSYPDLLTLPGISPGRAKEIITVLDEMGVWVNPISEEAAA